MIDIESEVFRLAEPDEWGYTRVPFELLRSSDSNVRKVYHGIGELASSIAEVGLLQNIVVVERDDGTFEIAAGERRYRAIERLKKEGKWNQPVPCLVIDARLAKAANAAENTSRRSVPIWHIGKRLVELYEAGLSQYDIAERIGRNQQYVSFAIMYATRIHPNVITKLDKLDESLVTVRLLKQLTRFTVGENCSPDEKAQTAYLERMIEKRQSQKRYGQYNRTHPTEAGKYRYLCRRMEELKMMPLPREQAAVVRAVLHYLTSQAAALRIEPG